MYIFFVHKKKFFMKLNYIYAELKYELKYTYSQFVLLGSKRLKDNFRFNGDTRILGIQFWNSSQHLALNKKETYSFKYGSSL